MIGVRHLHVYFSEDRRRQPRAGEREFLRGGISLTQQVFDRGREPFFRHPGRRIAPHDSLPVDEDERRRRGDSVAQHRFVADRDGDRALQPVNLAPGLLDLPLLLGAVRRGTVEAGRRDEFDALTGVLLDRPAEGGRLHPAVAARLPPEIEDDRLSAEGLERRNLAAEAIPGADGGRGLTLELDQVPALPDAGAQVEGRLRGFLRPRALFQEPDGFRLPPRRGERLRLDIARRAERVARLPLGLVVGGHLELRLGNRPGRLRVARGRLPVAGQRRAAGYPRETEEVLAVLPLLRAVV